MTRILSLTACVTCLATMPALSDTSALSAAGNEPFWRVDIENSTLTLTRPDFDPVILPVVEDGSDGTITAADAKAGLRAVLTLSDGVCRDSMSGLPYPQFATLSLGETTYTGCGGDPLDLLAEIDWTITSIGDTGLVEDAPAVLRLGRDGRLSGTGGCNRLMGGYTLTGEGVSFGDGVGTTMMACPDPIMAQERALLDALAQVIGFDIAEDGALVLRGAEGSLIEAAR